MCTRLSELGGGAYRETIGRTAQLGYARLNRSCVASKSPASDAIGKEIRA